MKKTIYFLSLLLIMLLSVNASAQKDKTQKKGSIKINGSTGQEPLYILDGEKISKFILETKDPSEIESINVYKGPNAIEQFGEDGKNGVIFILTKKGHKEQLKNKIEQINPANSKNQENIEAPTISFIYDKKINGANFEKEQEIVVKENLHTLMLSVSGNISKGKMSLALYAPSGESVVNFNNIESESIMLEKTLSFKENEKASGKWLLKISTSEATGNYRVTLKGY